MRHYPEDDYDRKEAMRMEAPDWMLDILKCNPGYVSWGPYEDYMISSGWGGPIFYDTWSDHDLGLNDLNEVVNFYFEINRSSTECPDCGGSGTNLQVKALNDDWYDSAKTGREWIHKLEQPEVDALWEQGRLRVDFKEKPTAEQVNAWSKGSIMGHDAINKMICVETRAKRLGIYSECETCQSTGYVYTEPKPRLSLVYWLCHPRKGASRGVEVKDIKREDLRAVRKFLAEARQRNHDRFAGIEKLPA